jgi:hypothetical protein
MKNLKDYQEFFENNSENIKYHIDNNFSLNESIFRIGSESWLELINEARDLYNQNKIGLTEDEIFIIGTDLGKKDLFEGKLVLLDLPFIDEELSESEYRGKDVDLNKPFRTPSGPRKFSVYTKNEKGNVVKVGFGQPGMRVNNADPKKAKSFRKRMRCDKPGPKWKAKYWSCNVGRYAKMLNLSSSRPW